MNLIAPAIIGVSSVPEPSAAASGGHSCCLPTLRIFVDLPGDDVAYR
jgi:hypothetical protein